MTGHGEIAGIVIVEQGYQTRGPRHSLNINLTNWIGEIENLTVLAIIVDSKTITLLICGIFSCK
jgi:hypothetical protein